MKTKAMGFLSVLFLTLALNVMFTSCGDDNDDDKPGTSGSGIIGTWKFSDNYGYTLITFNKDGSGVYIEKDYLYDENESSPFRYTYTPNVGSGGVLFLMYYDGYGNYDETETWIVDDITKNVLLLDGDKYYRVN